MADADKIDWLKKVLNVQAAGQPADPAGDNATADPATTPPPTDQLTTVTLQVVNQASFDLAFVNGRYDPGTMFPKPAIPTSIAAGDTLNLTVDFTTKDAQGNAADKGFYLVFKGGPQGATQVSLDCGFFYGADGKLAPQGSVDGSGYTATNTGDNSRDRKSVV